MSLLPARFCHGLCASPGGRCRLSLGVLWAALALWAGPPCALAAPAPGAQKLKLATWNLEWLMTPSGFNALKGSCVPADAPRRGTRRSIPCDVAADLERSATDIAGLARYARELDADVIAVQEVDGVNAARQIFPRHEFCFTGGPAVQNTGFAIRRGLPFRCDADLAALSLGDSVRRGATLTLFPGTARELHLLAVHLKSGCARGQLDAQDYACARLSRQGPALRAWLKREAAGGTRYAVLGDFNRDLLADAGPGDGAAGDAGATAGLWGQLQEAAGGGLMNTAQHQPYRNCRIGQPHSGYIDYILLGGALQHSLVPGSFARLTYSATDAWRLKLSDHCPVAVELLLY